MNVYGMSKAELAQAGLEICFRFLFENRLRRPREVRFTTMRGFLADKPQGSYGCGAYFPRGDLIWVSPDDCASPSPGRPMQWSFPGYTTDRTPMGVVAHEFGHFVDRLILGAEDRTTFRQLGGPRVSSYEPNGSEAWAESMRLYILNPAMLRRVNPKRFSFIHDRLNPVFGIEDPLHELRRRGATEKILAAATRKAKVQLGE